MAETRTDTAPAPIHIPAILQNPTNHALRQVEAYNAQQREKAQARREAKTITRVVEKGTGRGKRVIRRLDNAAFASNPHIVQPSRGDYNPPIPLQHRPPRASFPADTIPRSAPIPSVSPPERDPFSSNSLNGAFSTSLKGTRALLRKRGGRRVEGLVGKVESEIRGWLGGSWGTLNRASSHDDEVWTIIDEQPVDLSSQSSDASGISTHASSSRRMPALHQITSALPSLPISDANQIPAILEISRSPAHISWLVSDSFERLVVHLIARYYELVSWSDTHVTVSGQSVRLTNIILPNIAKPKAQQQSYTLFTPETSEVSGQSSSELPTSGSESDRGGFHSETDSEAATQRGGDSESESDLEEGYTLVDDSISDIEGAANITITSLPDMSDLALSDSDMDLGLRRTDSNTSSRYASSEGGSEFSGLGDSLTLPAMPRTVNATSTTGGGWIEFDVGPVGLGDIPNPTVPISVAGIRAKANLPMPVAQTAGREWEDKPTFFEYLYGA
ncbi:hypothetical protein IAR55_004085 [Kwoniella newhampshirensis]|uniref:R3H-associated N-terminal domain-containing protein n=1 Tax=Kwoniella newhampshirensis TaxID=1651941 RepID=A0AAW0YLN5_9TREE